MLNVTCWVGSSYEAFTGRKCLFLPFQLLLTNPFLFIIFSIKKERSSLNCFVIENEIIINNNKKKETACSLFFCKVPLLSFDFSILSMHVRFWGGFKQARSSAWGAKSPEQLCAHRAGGDLPFMALSLGELWEGIQASRKLARHRSILFCRSHSHMMVNKKGNCPPCMWHHNCVVCSKMATNLILLAQSTGPRGVWVAECPALSLSTCRSWESSSLQKASLLGFAMPWYNFRQCSCLPSISVATSL